LPVKLTSFTATEQNSKVELQWSAGEEINTAGYEVQRSTDGVHFTNMTTVAAQRLSHYATTDNHPANGMDYYRLRVSDNDGSATYSQIVSVKFNTASRFSVYPNLLYGKLTIDMVSSREEKETVRIYDAGGREVRVENIGLSEGANTIQLDLSLLHKRTYFIRLERTGSVATISKQ